MVLCFIIIQFSWKIDNLPKSGPMCWFPEIFTTLLWLFTRISLNVIDQRRKTQIEITFRNLVMFHPLIICLYIYSIIFSASIITWNFAYIFLFNFFIISCIYTTYLYRNRLLPTPSPHKLTITSSSHQCALFFNNSLSLIIAAYMHTWVWTHLL